MPPHTNKKERYGYMNIEKWKKRLKILVLFKISVYAIIYSLYALLIWRTWGILWIAFREQIMSELGSELSYVLGLFGATPNLDGFTGGIHIAVVVGLYAVGATLLYLVLRLPRIKRKREADKRLTRVPSRGYDDMTYIGERPHSEEVGYFTYEIDGQGRGSLCLLNDDEVKEAVKVALGINFIRGNIVRMGDTLFITGKPDKINWIRLVLF